MTTINFYEALTEAQLEQSVECSNCMWTGAAKEAVFDIPDYEQRVAPGEVCPVGECPVCSALVHYAEDAEEPNGGIDGEALATPKDGGGS